METKDFFGMKDVSIGATLQELKKRHDVIQAIIKSIMISIFLIGTIIIILLIFVWNTVIERTAAIASCVTSIIFWGAVTLFVLKLISDGVRNIFENKKTKVFDHYRP